MPNAQHPEVKDGEGAAARNPGYFFYSEGFENSDKPCLTKEDPEGGDPHIMGTLARVYSRERLWELCRIANASTDLIDTLRTTERNLTSLINAQHHDAVLMTPWREAVRVAISRATGASS